MIRCKMIVTELTSMFQQWSTPAGRAATKVRLTVANGPDNKTWSKYTPSGTIELQIDNPAALDAFKLGQAYFVDFTEAPFAEKDENAGTSPAV